MQLTERKMMASSCGAGVDEVTWIDGEAAVAGGGRRPRSARCRVVELERLAVDDVEEHCRAPGLLGGVRGRRWSRGRCGVDGDDLVG